YINPRKMITAQLQVAQRNSAIVIPEAVTSINREFNGTFILKTHKGTMVTIISLSSFLLWHVVIHDDRSEQRRYWWLQESIQTSIFFLSRWNFNLKVTV